MSDETTTVDNTEDDLTVSQTNTDAEPDVADTDNTEDRTDEEGDTFPRSYVERLRRESTGYRERANAADQLAQRLHTELVRATGKLADATDLAFAEEHLDDPGALAAAIDDLLTRKPHLASRRPTGDIGQRRITVRDA